jgi:cell division septation protein DedD
MKSFQIGLVVFLIGVFLSGCTTSQQSTDEEEQVYVFDEIPKENTIEAPKTGQYPNLDQAYYVVQIGAFTTKDRAETFADMSRSKLNNEINISYSEQVNLYVVQITPFYKSKEEAESVKNKLRTYPEFSDAWIVTVNK